MSEVRRSRCRNRSAWQQAATGVGDLPWLGLVFLVNRSIWQVQTNPEVSLRFVFEVEAIKRAQFDVAVAATIGGEARITTIDHSSNRWIDQVIHRGIDVTSHSH